MFILHSLHMSFTEGLIEGSLPGPGPHLHGHQTLLASRKPQVQGSGRVVLIEEGSPLVHLKIGPPVPPDHALFKQSAFLTGVLPATYTTRGGGVQDLIEVISPVSISPGPNR